MPGAMAWFHYSKETVPEGTWIWLKKNQWRKCASHLLCKQRQLRPTVFKTSDMHREPIYQHLTKVDQHFSKSCLTQLLLACKSAELQQLTANVSPTHGLCLRTFLGFDLSNVLLHTWDSLLQCWYRTSKSYTMSMVPGFFLSPRSWDKTFLSPKI